MGFLHGVEIIDITTPGGPITVVKSAVIGLVGMAPKGAVNTLKLCNSADDDAQFGSQLPGFDIPKALAAYRANDPSATVVVVNVYNPETMTTHIAAETITIVNSKAKLVHAPIISVAHGRPIITDTTASPTVTLVEGTDYTIDDYGNILITGYTQLAHLHANYYYADFSSVVAGTINGAVDGSGNHTGFTCMDLALSTFGFRVKILDAPHFSSLEAVAANMIVVANKFRACALINAPEGTTVAVAITGRGPSGAINFQTSDKRATLLFPEVKRYDIYTNADELFPYSSFFAGIMSFVDKTFGYWFSPSNYNIQGITGQELEIYSDFTDENSQTNQLNAVGITTIFNAFGTGRRTWGNRNAAWPTDTSPKNFTAIVRTDDVVNESIEFAMFQYLDKPMNKGQIDSITASVNKFIRTLIGRGALLQGSKCEFLASKNSVDEMALGHFVWTKTYMGPVPGERLTFDSFMDTSLLANLLPQ